MSAWNWTCWIWGVMRWLKNSTRELKNSWLELRRGARLTSQWVKLWKQNEKRNLKREDKGSWIFFWGYRKDQGNFGLHGHYFFAGSREKNFYTVDNISLVYSIFHLSLIILSPLTVVNILLHTTSLICHQKPSQTC